MSLTTIKIDERMSFNVKGHFTDGYFYVDEFYIHLKERYELQKGEKFEITYSDYTLFGVVDSIVKHKDIEDNEVFFTLYASALSVSTGINDRKVYLGCKEIYKTRYDRIGR